MGLSSVPDPCKSIVPTWTAVFTDIYALKTYRVPFSLYLHTTYRLLGIPYKSKKRRVLLCIEKSICILSPLTAVSTMDCKTINMLSLLVCNSRVLGLATPTVTVTTSHAPSCYDIMHTTQFRRMTGEANHSFVFCCPQCERNRQ